MASRQFPRWSAGERKLKKKISRCPTEDVQSDDKVKEIWHLADKNIDTC